MGLPILVIRIPVIIGMLIAVLISVRAERNRK